MYKTDSLEITCEDNMKLMARYPDGYFDLAVVDPPYGIGIIKTENGNYGIRKENKGNIDQKTAWDFQRPKENYWHELFRVSKNQIIWGGNYFTPFLRPSMGWFFWDKKNGASYFSDGELAYTSFEKGLRIFKMHVSEDRTKRIHHTQKPIKLYEWTFKNYANPGDKILDTHLGSGSIAIALDRMNKIEGMNLTLAACELDEDYYKAAIKRIQLQTAQTTIAL